MNLRLSTLIPVAAIVMAAPAAAQGGAPARAASYNNAIVGVMKQGAAMPARIAHFSTIVGEYYDMPGIAATVAGSAWASASAADRQALIAALTRHSAIQLAKNFDRYSGEQFVVDPTPQVRGDATVLKTTIESSGGKKDVLYYKMHGTRIVDVISGGVSQLAVQRSDIASIAASGGVSAVVKRFKEVDAKYS